MVIVENAWAMSSMKVKSEEAWSSSKENQGSAAGQNKAASAATGRKRTGMFLVYKSPE